MITRILWANLQLFVYSTPEIMRYALVFCLIKFRTIKILLIFSISVKFAFFVWIFYSKNLTYKTERLSEGEKKSIEHRNYTFWKRKQNSLGNSSLKSIQVKIYAFVCLLISSSARNNKINDKFSDFLSLVFQSLLPFFYCHYGEKIRSVFRPHSQFFFNNFANLPLPYPSVCRLIASIASQSCSELQFVKISWNIELCVHL